MGKKIYGVSIEGIGKEDGTGEANGIMWSTDPRRVPAGTGGYDWITANGKAPLADEFQNLNDTVEPFSLRVEASAEDLHFNAHDEVAERLLYRQTEAPYSLQSALGDDTSTDTTVDLGQAGLDNSIIYVHEETILLGTDSGGGVYTGCTRGHYDSKVREHASGSNAFTSQPFWTNRLVRTFSYDTATGTLTGRNRYRIDKAGQGDVIEQDVATIVVHCVGVLADLDSLKVNRDSNEVPSDQHLIHKSTTDPGTNDGVEVDVVLGRLSDTTRVRKESLWSADSEIATYVTGDILFAAQSGQVIGSRILNTYTQGAAPDRGAALEKVQDPIYEVFCVARQYDQGGTVISSTKDLAYPYHPLSSAAALLFSTKSETADAANFDVLQPQFSLDLRWLFDDSAIAQIKTLIEETQWMKIDQLVIGHDGDAVDIIDLIEKKLLKPWGFFWGLTTDGKLTIERLSLNTVDAYEEARANRLQIIEGTLSLSDGLADTIDVIQCNVGDLPWRKGNTLYVRAVDGDSERTAMMKGDPDLVLDFSTIRPINLNYVRNQVVQRALVQHFAIPRLRAAVNDYAETGADLDLGAYCTLEDIPLRNAWLVDRSGTRIKQITDDVAFTGQLYGRACFPREGFAFEIEMMFVSDRLVRLRAPSGIIDTYTDNGDGTSTITLQDPSPFGHANADASYFTTNKPIQVFNQNCTLHEATQATITAISSNSLTLNTTFTTAPTQDQIVEYAFYDSDASGSGYQADGLGGTYAYTDRVWVALADDAETIGDAGETADIYGA